MADLYENPHPSVPRNSGIANAAHAARLVERWGTGTSTIIEECLKTGLPQPAFEEVAGGFRVVVYRDPYTRERLESMGLNERQIAVVQYLKEHERLSTADYIRVTAAPRTSAVRDLNDLQDHGILERRGSRGRGVYYVLAPSQNQGGAPQANEPNGP